MLDDILSGVQKPGRYIGGEWNLPKKDFDASPVKFALCFPDLYEVGMSNLGGRIIYGLLNSKPDLSCERFFSPAADMEESLRKNHIEIFSLESKRSLKEFDLVGFSLGHELGYTNVLNMLELGRIPLKASLRDGSYPLIIAGGPCALNPEPMHEFFDLFVIGEAEEVILEITDTYRRLKEDFKRNRLDKEDLLAAFSQIEGVYAPSLFEAAYSDTGSIREFKPRVGGIPARVKKRFLRDLNAAYFPAGWLVPYIQIIHDRISIEVMRGCPNACRFCQARIQYHPLRFRSVKNILNLACDIYRGTGYEELSLLGLSVSDYSAIEELLSGLVGSFKSKGVSVSLPSIKPKALVGGLSSLLASVKKTGLTFAPEAATVRLRRILNKDFNLEDFFGAIEQAYISGYQRIKLYFMIGLPYEEKDDLEAIVSFAGQVSQLRRKTASKGAYVNISVNTLIPKPHTPFQWLKMQDLEGIKSSLDFLKSRVKNGRLKLNFHNPRMSVLEGLLSRGDRRLSRVIELAFKKGARFDAWQDYFSFDIWMDAFREANVDPAFYLREKSRDELLPWDFLDMGVSKEALAEEFNKLIDM